MRAVTFAVPGGLGRATGGAIYDRKVVDGLRAGGWRVEVRDWPDGFPLPTEQDRRAVAASLAAVADGSLAVVDGLALGTLPDLARAHARRLRLVGLVHHPLALETGLSAATAARLAAEEREALRWVRAVVATSRTTAATLVRDYAVPPGRIAVVTPGLQRVASVPRRAGPGPVRIISVGTVSPRKAHLLLVEALAAVDDLAWSCRIVGDKQSHPQCAAALTAQIAAAGLGDRIELTGEVSDAELARLYAEADLFAFASHFEGYGMAAAEAMAWGLPVVATAGGAIPEVVPDTAGLRVPPGDAAALAGALRRVIADGDLRRSLGLGAQRAAGSLGGWDECARRFAAALERIG